LLLFRFFIRDIGKQLEKNKCSSLIHVYYGQLMSKEQIQILKNNVGRFILISSFISAGSKHQIQSYFSQMGSSNDLERVLFEIEADPRLENIKPFSNITTQSYLPNEEQTLFMFGSIFRFSSIRLDQDHLWTARMVLSSETDHQLKSVLKPNSDKDSLDFGKAFCKLRRFDDAEKYYLHFIKSLPVDHEDIVLYYEELGNLEREKDDYDSSLQWFNKSLEIRMKILEIDHPDIGDSYNNIGEIYLEKNDFKRAFDLFNKAMTIYKKKLSDDHPKVAICFNNMGHVYKKDKKYPKALEFYQKAFLIRQKRFPHDHPQLADSYKNLGDAYQSLNDLDQALENYNRALKIYTKSASPSSFLIGIILKSIGSVYESKAQFQQARSYYEKAATSFRCVLSTTDHHLIQIQIDIQRVTSKLK
jgi:tetratricopeptide (TPR) repeat protein